MSSGTSIKVMATVDGIIKSFDKLEVANPKAASKSKNSKPKKSKKKKHRVDRDDYFKRYSFFKCTNVQCRKHSEGWKSAHGWVDEPERCEFCDRQARVMNVQDETDCQLDMYVCPCGNRWDCLHDPFTNEVACDRCETLVARSGTQQRHATHFWYECATCSQEWEAARTSRKFSQRCQVCHSQGEMVYSRRETVEERAVRIALARRGFGLVHGAGTHDVEGCDMCQELSRRGVASTCTRSKHIRVEEMDNGDSKFTDMTVRD